MTILIVPCFNEKMRLEMDLFRKSADGDLRILFVDDGSLDGTGEILKKSFSQEPYIDVLSLPKNSGKAEAVRQGVLHLQKSELAKKADWWGFWDADLATPLSEVDNFIRYAENFYTQPQAIWGSRLYRLGSDIRRSARRHYLGRIFATLIAHLLGIKAYDTQCGAKLFKPALAAKVFAEPFLSRWIFDVEILLRLDQTEVIEYPLKTWRDVPGSKVKVVREGFRVFFEILKLRKKYRPH